MSETPALIGPVQLLDLAVRHPLRWIVPALVLAALSGGAWQLRGERWEASQSWTVRNKAAGNADGPGKFRQEELTTAQETIQELVKSRAVLEEALRTTGPPDDYPIPAAWPRSQDVADLQQQVRLAAPDGAQFGTTEIFYLKVRAPSRSRSVVLASAIGRHVEARFQRLGDERAASMIAELRETVALAEADLQAATQRLAEKERAVGSDLGELRILSEALANNSDLRQRTIDLENELRAARFAARANQQLLELLRDAQRDPLRLLAMPNSLLESQPGLKRLKEGLVDAQLRTAQAQSSMTAAHPTVQAARMAETEVSSKLAKELEVAIRGIEADMRITSDRVVTLESKLEESRLLLARLAGERAEYANLVNEVKHRTRLLEQAQADLASAQASQAGARSGGWLSRLDEPDPGGRPVGPTVAVIAAAGGAAGLALGLGLLVLTTSPLIRLAPAETTGLSVNGRSQSPVTSVVYRQIALSSGHEAVQNKDAQEDGVGPVVPGRKTIATKVGP
ncbi:MAG: hypothetical protein HY000_23980 [Planctomycetes bacterium]|nr:hypothetical protein [Planctomycetota bacterium]